MRITTKKIITILASFLTAFMLAAFVSNLDVFLRFLSAYQNNELTMRKIRYDLAAFNVGEEMPVTPVAVKTSPQDGMPQVYIPAGEFFMGKFNARGTSAPQHTIYLDAYWFDQVEVSNAMYLKCLKSGACTPLVSDNLRYRNWIYRNHPVTYVTWGQAKTYCEWAGRQLPTEAQWEKAARGTDSRLYPWGDEAPNPRLANYAESNIHEAISVYRYPLGASPYGVLNMSGNVREWVMDWFDPKYYETSPYANPAGPETGSERSLRSGSYNEDGREILITKRYNHDPESAGLSRGFRCAEQVP